MRLILSSILAAGVSTLALAQTAVDTEATAAVGVDAGDVVSLGDWAYDDLYAGGWSAEDFMDEMEVVDPTGEEIGSVEDIIVNASGEILSVVAEVGGFWDIGDTHVSVPWDEVTVEGETVILPVTEENIEQYDYFRYAGLAGGEFGEDIVRGVDDLDPGVRAWRLSELIGDYARLRDDDGEVDYGYVNDVIIRDGQIAATVIDPGVGFGTGYYAYPYYGYGYGYGWGPGEPSYDLPYTRDEVAGLEEFEYERFE